MGACPEGHRSTQVGAILGLVPRERGASDTFLMFQVMLSGGTGKRVEEAGQGKRPKKQGGVEHKFCFEKLPPDPIGEL